MVTIDNPGVDACIDLSWRLNHGDPSWIPPIRMRLHQEFALADAFGAYGRMRLFGVESGGRLVGRIAAIVNPRLTDTGGRVLGQVGYFEAIDDDQVAGNLFGAAFDWLRSSGARRVLGPMNGGAHRAHRLMTAGFDREPFLFEPRNPAYYPGLFERAGFARCYSWYSMDVSPDHLRRALNRLPMFRINPDVKDRYDIVAMDPSEPGKILARMYSLLDQMWSGHIGYAPLDFAELAELFGPVLSLMSARDLHWLVDRGSRRDLGCAFAYPDYAAEVRALNGDASAWGHWRDGALPGRLVLHTLAVAPEARGHGGSMWLLRNILEHCADHYAEGVLALVVQEFIAVRKIAAPTREYALFEQVLD